MKTLFLTVLFTLMLSQAFAQDDRYSLKISHSDPNQITYLVTKSDTLKLDSTQMANIKPEWIKSVSVRQDDSRLKENENIHLVYLRLKTKDEKKLINKMKNE
jgi:hypothetical protein